MKKLILSLFSALMLTCGYAISPDSLVVAANKYYADNDFQKAAETYKRLINVGLTSPELYYNLGNAYYKMNNYAMAILNYERAILLNPNDNDVKYNLELANAHVIDKINVIPEFFLKKWIKDTGSLFHSNTWAIISVVFFIMFLILFLNFLFSGKLIIKKISFYLLLIFFIISVSGFYFSAQRKKMLINRDKAIIISPSVTAKSSPNEYGTNLFILHEGTKVEVVDSINLWNEIKLSNGNKGWILASALEKI